MIPRALKILILEDNDDLREGWLAYFQSQGHYVRGVALADDLLDESGDFSPDVYVIDLNLPVEGTLDDPTFRVGPVVWQIVKNLVVKIVTAPFAFLGSLFEGAEDAQFVVFAPGDPALTPEQQASLAALARGLAERPQLRITVPAVQVAALPRGARVEIDAVMVLS